MLGHVAFSAWFLLFLGDNLRRPFNMGLTKGTWDGISYFFLIQQFFSPVRGKTMGRLFLVAEKGRKKYTQLKITCNLGLSGFLLSELRMRNRQKKCLDRRSFIHLLCRMQWISFLLELWQSCGCCVGHWMTVSTPAVMDVLVTGTGPDKCNKTLWPGKSTQWGVWSAMAMFYQH